MTDRFYLTVTAFSIVCLCNNNKISSNLRKTCWYYRACNFISCFLEKGLLLKRKLLTTTFKWKIRNHPSKIFWIPSWTGCLLGNMFHRRQQMCCNYNHSHPFFLDLLPGLYFKVTHLCQMWSRIWLPFQSTYDWF